MNAESPGTQRAVEAVSFASRFPLKSFVSWLPDPVPCEVQKTLVVGRIAEGSTFFAFDFGAIVFINVARETTERILASVSRHLEHEPHPPLRESFLLAVDPSKPTPTVTFDAVVLPSLSPLDAECLATVLAQSVAIDYYDEDLQAILARVEAIARTLARTGRPGVARRDLVRFVAESVSFQVEMIASVSLLDKPDFTWDDEGCERLYDALRHHFEIRERHAALEQKLTTIRESLSHFLELNAERRGHSLELIVIALIAFEIVLGLWDHFGR